MTNPDVNNDDHFLGWVLGTFSLGECISFAPEIVPHILEALNNDWIQHCEEQNYCPRCDTVNNGDQTIDDHGMCVDCFHNRDEEEWYD